MPVTVTASALDPWACRAHWLRAHLLLLLAQIGTECPESRGSEVAGGHLPTHHCQLQREERHAHHSALPLSSHALLLPKFCRPSLSNPCIGGKPLCCCGAPEAVCPAHDGASETWVLQAQVPKRLYFGREVSMDNARRAVTEYALPKRAYLGPTSMDTEMSLIMCNQAKASAHHHLHALHGRQPQEGCYSQ